MEPLFRASDPSAKRRCKKGRGGRWNPYSGVGRGGEKPCSGVEGPRLRGRKGNPCSGVVGGAGVEGDACVFLVTVRQSGRAWAARVASMEGGRKGEGGSGVSKARR